MSDQMSMQLIWGALGIIALFGIVIRIGLRARKAQMARNLQIRAQDLWAPFAHSRLQRDALLYGVRQDRSMVDTELVVRNSNDEEVGRIVQHGATRTEALIITTDSGTFVADFLPTFGLGVVLHPANDATNVMCAFDRSWAGAHRFRAAGIGTLESRRRSRLSLAPISDFTLDGAPVGASQHIGGAFDRGILLILPPSVPLHVRMFVLALQ